jgi:hypothetical protein
VLRKLALLLAAQTQRDTKTSKTAKKYVTLMTFENEIVEKYYLQFVKK